MKLAATFLIILANCVVFAQDASVPSAVTNIPSATNWWKVHVANTDIVQWHPSFPAQYSGPHSMASHAESDETVDLDVFLGLRLWSGAELHIDGMAWQGFGLSHTLGIEAFPNAMAYKVGARLADATFARVFIRQIINLGGQQEDVSDDDLHLASKQDISHIELTVGEISLLDIFDKNTYAGDPTTQFLNWALVGNEAWDYPANSLGFITGFAAELYQPNWALRYGMFQIPAQANGLAIDQAYLDAWGMVTEFERHLSLRNHPGSIRLLAYLNRAHMGGYSEAIDSPIRPADILDTQAYRYKYGFCLNLEQELMKDVGLFARLGWSDGQSQAWVYSDVDQSASMGVSLNGDLWKRPDDTYGLAGVVSAMSHVHQEFLEDGGLGILAGDGALNYGLEKAMETYYNFKVWKSLHLTADYQFVIDPAFNRARGPVSILGGRLHWEF
ncbi:MAG TPA: carbohydrate porin [Verrucomicrobiae bacterium]|jgi:high affinity Mn2+ porin|nr:carbohydrate porin [Verrucomicrobiae bacterium]